MFSSTGILGFLDMLQHSYCKFVMNLSKFICEVPRCAKPSQKLQNHVFILTCFLSCSCTWTDLYLNNRIFVTEAKVYLCMHSLNVIVLIFWSFPSLKMIFIEKTTGLGESFFLKFFTDRIGHVQPFLVNTQNTFHTKVIVSHPFKWAVELIMSGQIFSTKCICSKEKLYCNSLSRAVI